MKKTGVFVLLSLSLQATEIENQYYKLDDAITNLLTNAEVLQELSNPEAKKSYLTALNSFMSSPNVYAPLACNAVQRRYPHFRQVVTIIDEYCSWNEIRALGLEKYRIKLLSLDKNTLEWKELRQHYAEQSHEKTRVLSNKDITNLLHPAIKTVSERLLKALSN